jgi:flagellar hook-length control protein FliK
MQIMPMLDRPPVAGATHSGDGSPDLLSEAGFVALLAEALAAYVDGETEDESEAHADGEGAASDAEVAASTLSSAPTPAHPPATTVPVTPEHTREVSHEGVPELGAIPAPAVDGEVEDGTAPVGDASVAAESTTGRSQLAGGAVSAGDTIPVDPVEPVDAPDASTTSAEPEAGQSVPAPVESAVPARASGRLDAPEPADAPRSSAVAPDSSEPAASPAAGPATATTAPANPVELTGAAPIPAPAPTPTPTVQNATALAPFDAELAALEADDPWQQLATVVRPLRQLADGTHRISLQLRPAELGTVHLEVALEDGRLSLRAVTEHAATRDLLAASMPELRSELSRSGIDLGSLDVGQDTTDGTDRRGAGVLGTPTREVSATRTGSAGADPLPAAASADHTTDGTAVGRLDLTL